MNRQPVLVSSEALGIKPALLIAEGDKELAELMCLFLSREGYGAEGVSDGLACMEQLRRLSPDILVLDLILPWGGGYGVLHCMHEEHTAPHAVILTGWEDSLDIPPGLTEEPVVRYLRKPFLMNGLLQTVRSVWNELVFDRLRDRHAERSCLA
jgi:DNA-binding response OmpR family regulator